MIRSLIHWARRRRWWILAYILLLVASNIVMRVSGADAWRPSDTRWAPTAQRLGILVPEMRDAGPEPGELVTISLLKWSPPEGGPTNPIPIMLLHGSPSGGALDFARLGPRLAASGHETYALDLPGFGRSEPWVESYSIIANARYTLAAMDQLNIDRAHIVGWSQGGGGAIDIADMTPERAATLSLLGSIGVQEAEGSATASCATPSSAISATPTSARCARSWAGSPPRRSSSRAAATRSSPPGAPRNRTG